MSTFEIPFPLSKIFVSKESSYFSHNPWQNMTSYITMIKFTHISNLQNAKLLRTPKQVDGLNRNLRFTSLE